LFRRHLFTAVFATAAVLASAASAQVTEVSGVKFSNKVTVAATPLQLNGAGTRFKAIFKVYSAALYLPNKVATPEAVLATAGPKRMHVVMLRDIDANELGKLFTRGMQDNSSRAEFTKSISGTIRLGEMFAAKKRLAAGEQFTVDFIPGQGTTIAVNGQVQGEPVPEPEFFSALMRIWLGRNPADAILKDALLGKSGAERAPHEG
jgi:Chalcone isomerase-like